MKNGKMPDPNVIHPIAGYDKEIYVKPTITNPNIVVGDFTYIADSEFESHVTHLYEWNGDKHHHREVLPDSGRCRICDERRKSSDECRIDLSVLHSGRLEHESARIL